MTTTPPSDSVPPVEPAPPAPPAVPVDPYAATLPYAPVQGQPYAPPPGYGYPAQPGYAQQGYAGQPYYVEPPYNTLAIVGFVLAFVAAIGAIVCGHIALSQIKRTGERGHGLALAAVILGYAGVALVVLYFLFVIIFVVAAGTNGAFNSGDFLGLN